MLELFQGLADNPRSRLVEFKYTKMGRRGEAEVIGEAVGAPLAPPDGSLFASPEPAAPSELPWRREAGPTSITVADIDYLGLATLDWIEPHSHRSGGSSATERGVTTTS